MKLPRKLSAAGQESGSVPSLDDTLDQLLDAYAHTGRLDGATEHMRAVLEARLRDRGVDEALLRLIEVNVLGNIAGWVELVLEEKERGRDAVTTSIYWTTTTLPSSSIQD